MNCTWKCGYHRKMATESSERKRDYGSKATKTFSPNEKRKNYIQFADFITISHTLL